MKGDQWAIVVMIIAGLLLMVWNIFSQIMLIRDCMTTDHFWVCWHMASKR